MVTRKVSACLQAALCTLVFAASGIAQEAISLAGSGSNLVAPLYSAWTSEFAKQHPNVQVTYLAVGTSQSIKTILAGSGDFGGGELPLTSAQKHDGERPLTQFPTVLVAIAPIYKLPENPQLRFSGELLAEIYLGNIKNWKDPRIAKLNPDVNLPNLPITTVHLSGFKGSNYILTDFLSKTSPEWKSKIGRTASPKWPIGTEINRSQGMVAKVSATLGSIGYVELTYAKRNDIGYGSVQNEDGEFVRPTVAGILSACTESEKSPPDDLGGTLVNAAGRDSYPLASFTFIYLPATGLAPPRSRALKDFWTWALSDGQEIARTLGYAPLPASVAAKSAKAVNSIR